MAPVPHAAYRPAPPPRPAAEEPKLPRLLTAVGWVAIAAGCALFAFFFFRGAAASGRRATEKAEVAREVEHMRRVDAWMRDTSANAPVPDSAGRPVPTSDRAKRMWVVSRMLVDRAVWEREVMQRHGAGGYSPPAAWSTPRYWANAGAYPEVRTYLEGRVAAIAEIEKTSAAWVEARTAALARESGMSAREVRDLFPPDFGAAALDEARLAKARLEIHRDLVRMDPQVHHGGGNQLRYDREDDYHRVDALLAKLNDASAYARQARERRVAGEVAALSRVFE